MDGNQTAEARARYVEAWNKTMVSIWREKITLLGAIDTGALLRSVVAMPVAADGRYMNVTLSQRFLEYGVYVDRGVGRETPRGNGGDIGREKVRVARPWFSRKYAASVHNLKEFYQSSMGDEFRGVISNAFK